MAKKKTSLETNNDSSRRFWRYCFILLLAGAVLLIWLSLLSFSPTDPPSKVMFPAMRPVDNAAGIVGAHLSYWLLYWLGGGAYMAVLFASIAAIIMMFGGRIGDVRWRLAGVTLLVIVTSSGVELWSGGGDADFLESSSGVLGSVTGRLLGLRFGMTGASVILAIMFGLGLMLSADQLVLRVPSLGKSLWRRRSHLGPIVRKLGQVLPSFGSVGSAVTEVTARPRPVVAVPSITSRGRPKLKLTLKPARKLVAALSPPKPAAKPVTPTPVDSKYDLPSTDLLEDPRGGYVESQEDHADQNKRILQRTLDDFNISSEVVGYMTGPVITMFELSLAPGVKVAAILNLANDIARALAVPGVRVVSPIPGKDTIGIEVPNLDKEIVRIKELMDLAPEASAKMKLPLFLGKDAGGDPIVADLSTMPHMLMAGTTGSGKSVCINAIIMSMLLTRSPEDVRLVLIDPKMVEMAAFENIPHLLCPIVNDARKAGEILEWAAEKMDERYELLKEANVKNISSYNSLGEKEIYERFGVDSDDEKQRIPTHLPYYVIIVDELADLVMTGSKDVEHHIIRIAQKARAVGIHLILSTQRPSVNVVTGLIKSNMPCRISFRVASRQESRIVLDQNGADVLLGQGDMLFLQPGTSNLVRSQGAFVEDSEIHAVVKALRKSGPPMYNSELMRLNSRPIGEGDLGQRDDLFGKGVEVVLTSKRGSVSLLQRRLQIGYSRASRMIDQMADAGILGEYKGSQARECLLTIDDWRALQGAIEADQTGASAVNGVPTTV